MHKLSLDELEYQTVLELPRRELLGALISISFAGDISLLENLLNHSFRNWHINVLNDNSVHVTVEDNLTQTQADAFCTEAVSVLSAQCTAELT